MFTSHSQDHQNPDVWAVVLAGGVGSRLAVRTRRGDGVVVPKQYCTLWGDRSLLEATLDRLEPLVAPERTVLVVAAQHEQHWRAQHHGVPDANILVQPADRGTAMGVLLGLMHIRRLAPSALVLMLPADHGVLDESLFRWRLLRCLHDARSGRVVVLGMEPEGADDGYGWILPGSALPHIEHLHCVLGFVEKPTPKIAVELRQAGALWSSFILTGSLDALLGLVARAQPLLFALVIAQLHGARGFLPEHLNPFYDELPRVDFSHDVLAVVPQWLWVAPAEACGWTDLGTPERLDRFLEAHRQGGIPPTTRTFTARPMPAAKVHALA